MWRTKNNMQDLFLSFHSVTPGTERKYLSSLRNLIGPNHSLEKQKPIA